MDADASTPTAAAAAAATAAGGAAVPGDAGAAAFMPPSPAEEAAAAAAARRAGSDDAMAGGTLPVTHGRAWSRTASVAAAAAAATAAAVGHAEPAVPLPAAADLLWHNGADFFADYALTRRRVDELTDELDVYGQGGFGVVLGCEVIAAADPPPPQLVVKRINVDPARMRVASGEALFEREVLAPMRVAAVLDEVGLADLLLYIIDGYMSTDPYTGAITIYVVMERTPGVKPTPLLVPTGAVEPPDGMPATAAAPCGSGVDLFDHIPLSPFAARMVMMQMLTVEAALHAHHFVHRDIKPENVLVAGWVGEGAWRYPRIKLADFSLMRLIKEGDPLTAGVGTRIYQPPEQLRRQLSGEMDYDGGVDVFATGVVWYVAVTGNPPVSDKDMLREFHEDAAAAAQGDTEEEALAYFHRRFPLVAAPGSSFINPDDGSLNDDGRLMWYMTLRWRHQRLTAAQCLEYPTMMEK